MALRWHCPDAEDPKAAKILEKQKKARQAELDEQCKSEVAGPMSSQLKRKSATTPRAKGAKKSKSDSPAPIPKENKNQVTELRRFLRESETQLQSARDRVKKLENKEDDMKKSYEELKKKNEEKLEGYADLRDLKHD